MNMKFHKHQYAVHRHAGGLENLKAKKTLSVAVHRHAGGLES